MKTNLAWMGLGAAVLAATVAVEGCHRKDLLPTASSEVVEATPVAAAPAPATPQPVVAEPSGPGWSVVFYTGAGWKVVNETGIGQSYRAYTTSFDNQEYAARVNVKDSGTVPAGKDFSGNFETQCVQLDLTQDLGGGVPFTFAYFDAKGKEFDPHHNPEKVVECRTCVPVVTQRVVVSYEGEGCYRKKVITTYTLDSCTKEETAVAVKVADPVAVYRTDGYFSVDELSTAGNLYSITDTGLPGLPGVGGVWKFNQTLPAGSNLGVLYPHNVNGKTLTLWYLLEKIGSAVATCPVVARDWHGKVSFVCRTVNTCEQGSPQ